MINAPDSPGQGEPRDWGDWGFDDEILKADASPSAVDGQVDDPDVIPKDEAAAITPADTHDEEPERPNRGDAAAVAGQVTLRASTRVDDEASPQAAEPIEQAAPAAAVAQKPAVGGEPPDYETAQADPDELQSAETPATAAAPADFDFDNPDNAETLDKAESLDSSVSGQPEEPEELEDTVLQAEAVLDTIDEKWGIPQDQVPGFGESGGMAAVRYTRTAMQPTAQVVAELDEVMDLFGDDRPFRPMNNYERYNAAHGSQAEQAAFHEDASVFDHAARHVLRNTVALMEQADAGIPEAATALQRVLPQVEEGLLDYAMRGREHIRAGRYVPPELTKFIDHYAHTDMRPWQADILIDTQVDAALKHFGFHMTREVRTGEKLVETRRTAGTLPVPVVELARQAYVQRTTKVAMRGELGERRQRIWRTSQVRPRRTVEMLAAAIKRDDHNGKMRQSMSPVLQRAFDTAVDNDRQFELYERAEGRRQATQALQGRARQMAPPKVPRVFDDNGQELKLRLRVNLRTGEETVEWVPVSKLRTQLRDRWEELQTQRAEREQRQWR